MSVEARDGVFRARVRRSGLSLSASFPTRAEAEAWRATVIADLEHGRTPTMPRSGARSTATLAVVPVTLEQACREWGDGALRGTVRTRGGRRYREGSVHTGEYRLRLHVLPYLGGLPVASVSPGTIRRWLEELEALTSATTARLALDALRPVMRRLVEHELIPVNPCTGVRPPAQGEEARPIRFLTPEEGAALRQAADADRNPGIGPYVDLGLACAARRGELLGITWGHGGLDLEQRTVTISASHSLRTRQMGPTKSGLSRVVPIGARVAGRLREYRLASGRPDAGERVFDFDPRPAWERVRRLAGLGEPMPTIHSLRRSAACWWLASGLTVHAVSDLLGHADPTLVIRLYGHALPAEISTAGDRLEAFLEDNSGD